MRTISDRSLTIRIIIRDRIRSRKIRIMIRSISLSSRTYIRIRTIICYAMHIINRNRMHARSRRRVHIRCITRVRNVTRDIIVARMMN